MCQDLLDSFRTHYYLLITDSRNNVYLTISFQQSTNFTTLEPSLTNEIQDFRKTPIRRV